jgi:membrane fusion protein, multidrug efflux system
MTPRDSKQSMVNEKTGEAANQVASAGLEGNRLPASIESPNHPRRRWWRWAAGGVILVVLVAVGVPWIISALNTVTTDDAYVNGHVTFVAPRVSGQISRVFVDDNNRVRKGDLLVEIDKKPFQVQVDIAQAAVETAQSEIATAQAQTRATEAQARTLKYALQHSIEDVANQVALLRSKVAVWNSKKANLAKAQADYERMEPLIKSKIASPEEFDLRKQALRVAQAQVDEAMQGIYQIRVSLGLPPVPPSGDDLTQVPPDLDQNFSTVRQAQNALAQAAAQLGVTDSFNKTPKQMVEDFYKRDPQGDIDRIYAKLLVEAPAVKQAEAKLLQAKRNLDQANLNLSYCNVYAEIDGVVTRRNVNPGNNVVVGQSLMAVRSLTEIWIDANFKETQLSQLRIGQNVDLDVDMYGSRKQFKGRISGFTMGTGSTLSLLPAENATGNFVKVVQRLPVRIEVIDYDPDKEPLFIGLSVTPSVRIKEPPTGPDAGKFLQPNLPTDRHDTSEKKP